MNSMLVVLLGAANPGLIMMEKNQDRRRCASISWAQVDDKLAV
ncbi:unnamed protein product [Rhodiola kirilowii]